MVAILKASNTLVRSVANVLRNIQDCIVIIATIPRGPARFVQRSMKAANRSDLLEK